MPEILDETAAKPVTDNLERESGEAEAMIVGRVREMRKKLCNLPNKLKREENFNAIARRIKDLQKTYTDFQNVYLFHVVSGSTTDRRKCVSFDFPGDDSIVKILEKLMADQNIE